MAMQTNQLASTRVLVTGGTAGLGRAMAAALAASGADVVLTSRDRARAEAAAAEIGAIGIELDVRDESSVQPAWTRRMSGSAVWTSWSVTRDRHADGQPAVHDRSAAVLGGLGRTGFATWSKRNSPARSWSHGRWRRGWCGRAAAGSW